MKLILISAFIPIIMVSCSPKYLSKVSEDYVNDKISNATLYIAPICSSEIYYSGDVTNELGEGNPEELIESHFKDILKDGLKRNSLFRLLNTVFTNNGQIW